VARVDADAARPLPLVESRPVEGLSLESRPVARGCAI